MEPSLILPLHLRPFEGSSWAWAVPVSTWTPCDDGQVKELSNCTVLHSSHIPSPWWSLPFTPKRCDFEHTLSVLHIHISSSQEKYQLLCSVSCLSEFICVEAWSGGSFFLIECCCCYTADAPSVLTDSVPADSTNCTFNVFGGKKVMSILNIHIDFFLLPFPKQCGLPVISIKSALYLAL